MSKKLGKKKKSLDLDFEFEATEVAPTVAAPPPNPPAPDLPAAPTQEAQEAEQEAERRRKIRARQLALQNASQSGATASSDTTTPLSATTSNIVPPVRGLTPAAQTVTQSSQAAQLQRIFKHQNEVEPTSSDDDSDSSDSDDGVFSFMSSKEQKKNKTAAYKNVDMTKTGTIDSADHDLQAILEVSTAIIDNAVEQMENTKEGTTHDELPDDTDNLEDLHIDITAWRHREAQRLFREVEERMKQIQL